MVKRVVAAAVIVLGTLLVAGAVVRLVGRHRVSRPATLRPSAGANLLLITLDTTRADYLGAYGSQEGLTPNLDRLAAGGVTFVEAQATAPITAVAHASILTGLYPYHHGVRNNGMFTLGNDIPTLATVLAERGYRTGAFVSAYVLARRYGLDRGFEVYDDDLSRGRHEQPNMVPSRRAEVTLEGALTWLSGLKPGERFFCWIHFYDPHAPYDPPEEFRRSHPTDPYGGEIAYMDATIGRLLTALEERDLMRRTIVTAIADHGESLGEHGEQTHALLLHQATVHVPWIMAGPRIPHGLRVEAPVSSVDLAPTVYRLLAAQSPADMDGQALVGPFTDEALLDRPLYSETLLPTYQYGWSPLRGVRRNRWELVSGARDALYDLRSDPRELVDVADREASTTRDLARQLHDIDAEDAVATARATRTTLGRGEMERLQALGYIGVEVTPRLDPPDPRDLIVAHVHTERARALAAMDRPDEALGELQVMLDEDPQNISALSLKAQLLAQTRRSEEARQTLDKALTLDPDNAPVYRQLAQLELSQGNVRRALELARIGQGKRGAFESLTALEAAALTTLGRVVEAASLLDDHLQDHPDDADLLATRAGLYSLAGDRDAAERLLRHAVAMDALHLRARLALSELLAASGRSEEAVALLEELLRIDPGHPEALARIGALRLDDPAVARPYLEEAVRLQPSRADHLQRLGVCYVRLGDHRRGEATLRRALELDPDNPDVLSNLAVPLTLERRYDEAEEALRTALARRPRFAEAHNNLAMCLLSQRRYREAEGEAQAALALEPGRRDARLTLSAILVESGRAGDAASILENLRREDPEDHELAARLGVALEAAGRPADALPLLRAVFAEYADNLQVVAAAARAEEGAGDADQARRHYAAVARMAPPGDLRDAATAALERLALAGR